MARVTDEVIVHAFRLGAKDAVTEYAMEFLRLIHIVKFFATKGTSAPVFHRYLLDM
jgi:hypothetical protein